MRSASICGGILPAVPRQAWRRADLQGLRPFTVRAVLGLVAASLLSMTLGCAHVAPYERGTLAHPTMSAEDPYTTVLAEHVEDVSEGATGGFGGGGGGCGCN